MNLGQLGRLREGGRVWVEQGPGGRPAGLSKRRKCHQHWESHVMFAWNGGEGLINKLEEHLRAKWSKAVCALTAQNAVAVTPSLGGLTLAEGIREQLGNSFISHFLSSIL